MAGAFGANQLHVNGMRDPTYDVVRYRGQIAGVALEPLGPQMNVGLGIDQLGVDVKLTA